MKSGLLWYDNSSAFIENKIEQAAKRYQEKFGQMPNVAFVNPKDEPKDQKVKNILVKSKATIMPNHIWLGMSE